MLAGICNIKIANTQRCFSTILLFHFTFFSQLMATGTKCVGTENEKLGKFDIFQFSKDVGEETSKRIDLELTPKKSVKIMKTRSKTHTRLIINNMNRNGMNCHAYMKCYQKTTVPRSRYIPNLKCYMNESAKALFLSDCEDNQTFHAIRKTEKKKKKSKNTKKIIVRSRKGYVIVNSYGYYLLANLQPNAVEPR